MPLVNGLPVGPAYESGITWRDFEPKLVVNFFCRKMPKFWARFENRKIRPLSNTAKNAGKYLTRASVTSGLTSGHPPLVEWLLRQDVLIRSADTSLVPCNCYTSTACMPEVTNEEEESKTEVRCSEPAPW